MDWVFKLSECLHNPVHSWAFQSLLYWIGYSNYQSVFIILFIHGRFNPCCIGLGIQTCRFLVEYSSIPVVSILVVLDWVFKPSSSAEESTSFSLFQSLLYWIGYSNLVLAQRNQLHFRCFNPCCIGLGIQTGQWPAASLLARNVSILVVLDWVFKRCGDDSQLAQGKVSILVVLDWVFKRDLPTDAAITLLKFQSLLYWIGYSNPHHHQWFRHANPVSILVVLDWVFKQRLAVKLLSGRSTFQSLLYWIGYSNVTFRPQSARTPIVSILVVLDWVFKPRSGTVSVIHGMMFQSLLYWIGYSNHDPRI